MAAARLFKARWACARWKWAAGFSDSLVISVNSPTAFSDFPMCRRITASVSRRVGSGPAAFWAFRTHSSPSSYCFSSIASR